jgi:hypothetical protein
MWLSCFCGEPYLKLLPTRVNLAKMGVAQDTLCPICGLDDKVVHILWTCPSSNDVWGGGPVKLQKSDGVGGSFPDVLESVFGMVRYKGG